ncbi:MAG: XTP/dITP diphosphatase [archaeon]
MIHFATTNPGKFREAKALFEKNNLELSQFNEELTEIQTDDVEQLALHSVREAYEKLKQPVFVEDAGIFIKSLKGFPGVYSKQAYLTIGLKGILKLLEGVEDRSAEFCAVIAYKDGSGEKVFKGVCIGNISREVRGRGGFGFDPIFLPKGREKTFAEDVETKSNLSHRANALSKLIGHLKNG